MYLRNSWYVIAWSRELGEKPVARKIMDESIVIFRTADGRIGALEDRCPHRQVPLSMGKLQGNCIQCCYHGLQFDIEGICVSAPSQDIIPSKAKVKSYPAVEKYGWIWVWMGEAGAVDAGLIPDFSKLTDSGYKAVGTTNHVLANYRLVTDNLMDLSHVGFVHTTTIGNQEMGTKGELSVKRLEQGVRVLRLVPDVPPPPTYIKTGVLPEGKNIDRWQVIDFVPPCFVLIHVGGAEAGTGALEGRYQHGLNMWILNAMTPETDESVHYFWASVRQHALDNPMVDELFFEQVSEAFEEDKRVLEAQQSVLSRHSDLWSVALKGDAGCLQVRRVLDKLIRAEQAAA